jgi:Methyltransferase domain
VWNFENTKETPLGWPSEFAMSKFRKMDYQPEDFYEYFACFAGAKQIGRYLSFFECYKRTLGIAGHIAEVGVYRGAVSLFFAKLLLLYEPHSITQVHGFDAWPDRPEGEKTIHTYVETYQRVKELVEVQGLQCNVLLHQMDVRHELKDFFAQHPHLRFKLVFLDAGEHYETVAAGLREFWPRLTPGGILILDQYNHEVAPGETRAVHDMLPANTVIRTFPHGWMPTAYVVKE